MKETTTIISLHHGTAKRTRHQERNYATHPLFFIARRANCFGKCLGGQNVLVRVRWFVPIYLRLREFRHALGLTQAELAARAGVRRATVSRLENSRVTAVDLVVLEKLADLLGVEPGFLLSRTPPRTPADAAAD